MRHKQLPLEFLSLCLTGCLIEAVVLLQLLDVFLRTLKPAEVQAWNLAKYQRRYSVVERRITDLKDVSFLGFRFRTIYRWTSVHLDHE